MKRLVGALLVGLLVAGCTAGGGAKPTDTTSTITSTVTGTRPVEGADYKPPVAAAVTPLRPGKKPEAGAQEGACPYIRTGVSEDPTKQTNVAEIEGNHIYRTVRLINFKPVGCRFYFYAPPYNATSDILPTTFATTGQAYSAMILTARAGKDATTYKDFSPGLTGISYRTKFVPGDGETDWAFVFVKGTIMVVVHTSQNISANARYLAQAIAAKF